MMTTKQEFDKTGGVIAYHGYQSFARGEATPEIAHEIGVKLAKKLWGDKYQVLVATHLDKSNHLHNHFVINTVSHIDGKKFHRTEQDYYNMQRESDALCREYGLSVVEGQQRGKSKQYGEWRAEQENRPTYRSLIKTDVDRAIAESMTERQLWDNLKKQGYHIKFGKDITLRAAGKDSGLKLFRKALEIYSVKESDLKNFYQGAKQYGIVYCVLRNGKNTPDGLCDVLVKAEDAPKISRVAERFKFATVDKAKIESEIVAAKAEKATGEKTADAEPTAPEINDPETLVDDLLGTPEGKAELEQSDAAKAEPEKEPTDSRPLDNAPPKNSPSAPTSENRSKSAKGISKPSVKEELREIKAAQKAKEADAPARDEKAASDKAKPNPATAHKQPQSGRKPKTKKTKERG